MSSPNFKPEEPTNHEPESIKFKVVVKPSRIRTT